MGNIIFPKPDRFTAQQVMDDPILYHFAHLPPALKEISEPFCNLAAFVIDHLPRNAERSVALRKLLEAKDAAVRANVPYPGVREKPAPTPEVGTPKIHKDTDPGLMDNFKQWTADASQRISFDDAVSNEIKTTGGEHSETPIPFDD